MSPCKRAHTGHRLIKNASQRENVACRLSTLAEDLFRGHVARCAHHPAHFGGPTQSARAPSRLQLGLELPYDECSWNGTKTLKICLDQRKGNEPQKGTMRITKRHKKVRKEFSL